VVYYSFSPFFKEITLSFAKCLNEKRRNPSDFRKREREREREREKEREREREHTIIYKYTLSYIHYTRGVVSLVFITRTWRETTVVACVQKISPYFGICKSSNTIFIIPSRVLICAINEDYDININIKLMQIQDLYVKQFFLLYRIMSYNCNMIYLKFIIHF